MALVAAGISMLWAPQNPRGFPVYGYKGKAGYSLMDVFDSKAGGAMVVASLPEGRPLWLEQIRDNFLHPSNESLANYACTVLGDDDGDDIDFDVNPTREEPILLSSEEPDDASFCLIRRSSRAGPQRGPSEEPAADDVDTHVVDLQAGTVEQVETRKKKRGDKTREKKAEEPVAETPRKRPSTSSYLDYVVVSDTLSGLDAGVKRPSHDSDDDSTLTEIMKKRKLLEEKKKELDSQAAAALAEKKSKLQKETVAAPSKSEIDLGVFSEKTGYRLEKNFKSASGSRPPKSGRYVCKVDISKINPPTSPPSKPLDLSPPNPDPKGKGMEDEVEVEQVEKVVKDIMLVLGEMRPMLKGLKRKLSQGKPLPKEPFILNACGALEEVVHLAFLNVRNFTIFRVGHGLAPTLPAMIFPMPRIGL
ncbi:hypothetical protein HanOQP8_Chr05g0192981 [Helianthus annuus]|nr:hypothetical protein HanOQP8_Chr05g0192981 [Helianthus annuus]